ncbi:dihydrodipicolinate synthase family protein [Bordetella sp. 15P40C-2]|uniref:dihydrodipicolinate synthase family protein n=1 Tax=Bordetella sp. 15P40C-2 TaxID=2572246 RepID=UPI0013245EF6|nr:dihydrodipicolinate synthase family protein [Bordetella sp. 15P40C-2]MVW72748.1 dihydrodipicolinate synthase family protein [Bordetella sp. 15P40C-2]
MSEKIRGVLSPVVTPFRQNGRVDLQRFIRHCHWLQTHHVGLAFLGTNSEANSLSPGERIEMIDALLESGISPGVMMPGTGACDLPTAVRLSRKAAQAGCAGVLTLPPFYYKGVSDEGLFRFFAELIEQVGDQRLRIYLYHIPPATHVGISLDLIDKLLTRYPGSIAGIKDSSGDWNNMQSMLVQFKDRNFDVFPGSEVFLLKGLRHGAIGCISATANVNPAAIYRVYEQWQTLEADQLQNDLDRTRGIFQRFAMIPALKAAVAHWANDAEWRRVRPPLVELTQEQEAELISSLKETGFSMPGLV